jgi:glycosyltransferase involved in cell wall biosynthesis
LSSAAYSLAKQFAQSNKVFYFDYPYTFKDYVKGRNQPSIIRRKDALLKGKNIYTDVPANGPNFKVVTPRTMIPFYFLPPGTVYNVVEKVNNTRFFKTVRQVLHDHGIKDFVFFNSFSPFYGFEIPADLRPSYFVYQTRDNLRAIPELAVHGPTYERIAAKNADIVLATSTRLHEILEEETGKEVHLLPNAAQTDLFKKTMEVKYPLPVDFPSNGKKVVGFIGNVGPRMDLDLVEQLLQRHADKNFVMVGPDNLDQYNVELKKYKNLFLLGARKLDELPAYLQYMDVMIIPFLKDELTRSIYPLKLNEQLAAGRAIVTTDFSRDVEQFNNVVYIARSHEDFCHLVDIALEENSSQRQNERMRVAEENSWSERVEQFWKLLEDKKPDS